MNVKALIVRKCCAGVCVTAALACTACGSGESESQGPRESAVAQVVGEVEPPANIPSLPAPALSETPPTFAGAQPPPDGPTPLRPTKGTAAIDADALAPNVLRQTVAKGLVEVTDLRVVPSDGTVFVLERSRGLSAFSVSRERSVVFAPEDLVSADGVGMMGLALSPRFDRDRRVYVFMTSSLGAASSNRIARLTLDAALAKVVAREDVLIGIPFAKPSAARSNETRHLGGRMAFGPDERLYVATGDGYLADAPQARSELAGKVLRLDRPVGGAVLDVMQSSVVAVGLRDAAGIAFHPNHEAMVVADCGGSLLDEVNVLTVGANAGWDPRCAGTAFDYCGDVSAGAKLVPMNTTSAMQPSWRSSKRGSGLANMALLRGPQWRQWNGALALAFDGAQRIDLVKLDHGNKVVRQTTLVSGLGYGFSAIDQGSDGLYVATRGKLGGDEVVRLVTQ
jgi:aldose sugar dehydrogenase